MPAHFIAVGEPAHDAERQALRFLVEGLPATYTVYGNAWLTEATGAVYELDAVVVAPHAVFVVEIKGYRGTIEGTDHDWFTPEPIPSPLGLNRKTAQVLHSLLKRENFAAGNLWVQGLVWLSATLQVGVKGPASKDRLHTRKTILDALQSEDLIRRLSGRQVVQTTSLEAESAILRLLQGSQQGPRPVRRVREYEILETRDHQEGFSELLGRNTLSQVERLLRIYKVPLLARDDQRKRIEDRARWEAQVLGRLGRSPGILKADPPFSDEAGIVIPLEHFAGISLSSWLEKYGPLSREKRTEQARADLQARTDLWIRIAEALQDAHEQGVVHRLLRPEVVLVEDSSCPREVRVTGFDLAKQLTLDLTTPPTTVPDERLRFAAPEVLLSFSSAEPASDQFSLGVLLAMILVGRPLFENTRLLMATQRLMTRVRDVSQRIPLTLDEAVTRMVAYRVADRFSSLREAMDEVRKGRAPEARPSQTSLLPRGMTPDPDNLERGDRVGTDYEILDRLGQGGMATVYAARHLVSGRTRALKVSRAQASAEEALRNEYAALSNLDHPGLVKVIDLTKMLEGRLTLVMERVGGMTLRQWLASTAGTDPNTLRRYAEDLLAAVDYLENKGVTHKDLKPDNLLVGDAGLTVIDFSLVAAPEDAVYGGTALYRDPASLRWGHVTDRYAAALCLFELYAGRHAFDGRVPEPGRFPFVTEEDIDPPGLAAFFLKALHPSPEQRFRSAKEMREGLLRALGEELPSTPLEALPAQAEASTPLALTGLGSRAVNQLRRGGINTAGELLALSEQQIRNIHSIGNKTAAEVIATQLRLRAQGVQAVSRPVQVEPPILADLMDCQEPLERLPLASSLQALLKSVGLGAVGSVASLTRSQLLQFDGMGRGKLTQVVEALHRYQEHTPEEQGAFTLDRFWELASRPLTELQRTVVERVLGLQGPAESMVDLAPSLNMTQSTVSRTCSDGLERLERPALAELQQALEAVMDGFYGLASLDEVASRFESQWPSGFVLGTGLVHLLVRIGGGQFQLLEVEGAKAPILASTRFDRPTIRSYVEEAVRLASQWPPLEPESTRRALQAMLPHYEGNPLELAVRLCADLNYTDGGYLFVHPLSPQQSIGFVLEREREGFPLDELEARVRQVFGESCPFPDREHLLEDLRDLHCQVRGGQIVREQTRSVMAPQPLAPDELPMAPGPNRSPEEVIRDMLRESARTRGFRMLVTPPEQHAALGPSVAAALGGTWLSFEDAFFTRYGGEIARLERAERFIAQRYALTECAEGLMEWLLEEYGRPGRILVLGDTALLGLCEALDLPRRLYDETLSGEYGFWVLVVPGVIHQRQPRFNEGPAMWHLEGATLPLFKPLAP